jgi:lipopolysaccharide transport system ATP-binding protein
MNKETLLTVTDLHKKFCKDVKYNMLYGSLDLAKRVVGRTPEYLTLRKREFWALRKVGFSLQAGEILGVVGTNGSGKTTLMRLISGIFPVDAGEVLTPPDLKITAIFALSSGMQPLFSGRENIYIKGAMFGMTREQVEAQISFIEDFSELGERLDRPFGNYSSGMRARLSYAIAMATEPDLFIIDESLAVGDSAFKAKCIDNLKDFVQQPGKGVIFVSNQLRKVQRVATRLIVMDEGQLVHATEDVSDGLKFYVNNCYRNLSPEARALRMKKVEEYEG